MNRTINARRWDFALQLENSITAEFVKQMQVSPGCLLTVLQQFLEFQNQICLILKQACQIPTGTSFPAVDACILLDEAKWQIFISDYASTMGDPTQQYTQLWLTKTAFEKNALFYRQFAANTLDPTARLFLASLSEVKKIAARRVESALRVCINKSWEKLGFCPFPLN